jgi:hypothetical protein
MSLAAALKECEFHNIQLQAEVERLIIAVHRLQSVEAERDACKQVALAESLVSAEYKAERDRYKAALDRIVYHTDFTEPHPASIALAALGQQEESGE